MLNSLKSYAQNLPGWKTSKKILVIQSDDWGAQRTSSPEALTALSEIGIPVQHCHFTTLDSLEGNDDLSALFDALAKFRDHRDTPVRFTANCLMANPDYRRIADDRYHTYYYEPVADTAQKSRRTDKLPELWKAGYSEGFFMPQLHGREHLQTRRWLKSLRANDRLLKLCFEHEMYGLSAFFFEPKRKSYLAALDYEDEFHAKTIADVIHDAMEQFREIFGHGSESFIAPNYVWDDHIEALLKNYGVRYLQSARVQRVSEFSSRGKGYKRRWQGSCNQIGQAYVVRNVHFEPASSPSNDWVASALREMSIAFQTKAPAVLSTHRVNFIGHFSEQNRTRNLKLLQELLQTALLRWPDLEFWTTTELGDAMTAHSGR